MTVTVAITCHNQAWCIRDAVESALNQTVPCAVVIVDDGSTDESWQAIGSYRGRARILGITNRGMASARNAAIAAADTEWVVTLDGDDWLQPDYVEKCLAASEDADVVATAYLATEDGMVYPDIVGRTLNDWLTVCRGPSCSMFRRDLLVETGGYHPATGFDCDWDMWIDLIGRGARLVVCDNTYFNYRQHPGSYTRSRQSPQVREANKAEIARHMRWRDPSFL